MPERALNTKQLCSCVLYNNFDLYAKNATTHLSHDERLGNSYPILDYQPDRGFFNVFVELL